MMPAGQGKAVMAKPMAWGLVGPGRIAAKFADALRAVDGGARLVTVTGRDAGRTRAFAERWGVPRTAPSLDALLADCEVQAVYVATPHAFHADAVRACLRAGRPVLCEKPLVPDAATARELVALARARGVFLMEAVWTRFLPVYAQVAAWLRDGAIGPLQSLQSSFCFAAPYDPHSRLFDPAQAGGALLDIGIYNLTVTRWVLAQALGTCRAPQAIDARAWMAPTGVDRRLAATLHFDSGLVSQFVCGFDGVAENSIRIHGVRGLIVVHAPFWGAGRASLHRPGRAPEVADAPQAANGFEYEIGEVQRCLAQGLTESPAMPLDETLATLDWMDAIRRQVGLRYPFEAA